MMLRPRAIKHDRRRVLRATLEDISVAKDGFRIFSSFLAAWVKVLFENLVVNTDASQIIVADAGQPVNGGLPAITYSAGGLEEAGTRKYVCDILEGGEEAFRERARRVRVSLER